MEDDLNFFKNVRQPQYFQNWNITSTFFKLKKTSFYSKWKTTAKPKLILGLAKLSKIFLISDIQIVRNPFTTNNMPRNCSIQMGDHFLGLWHFVTNLFILQIHLNLQLHKYSQMVGKLCITPECDHVLVLGDRQGCLFIMCLHYSWIKVTHMRNLLETGFVTLVVNLPIKSELMGGGPFLPEPDTIAEKLNLITMW